MSNFVIKPNTLLPSTYSSIGSVLLPSKPCNNTVINSEFGTTGSKITPLLNGTRALDKSYISTFKRFDRSLSLSVPTVTNKIIYPCSKGKYVVTKNSNYNSDSSNFLISKSNNQLYQQYNNNNNNNNTLKCKLNVGVYEDISNPSFVVNDSIGRQYLFIVLNGVFYPILLNLSSDCTQRITLNAIEPFLITITLISSTAFRVNSIVDGVPVEFTYVALETSNADNNDIDTTTPVTFGDCEPTPSTVHTISSIVVNSNIITIVDNGVTINLENYGFIISSPLFRFYFTNTVIYGARATAIGGDFVFINRIDAFSRCATST